MESITHSSTPARRSSKAANKPARAKKLPEAAVEATAETFLTLFKSLPGAVQWRIVQKLDDYEDELAAAQLEADMAANPADYDRKHSVPIEQVFAEYEARRNVKL